MKVYTATDSGSQVFLGMLRAHCPARQHIQLKVGAQVVLVKTAAPAEGLVNGALGVVTKFAK